MEVTATTASVELTGEQTVSSGIGLSDATITALEEVSCPVVEKPVLKGVDQDKVTLNKVSKIKKGLELIGELDIEDFTTNQRLSRNITTFVAVEKAYGKSMTAALKKCAEGSEKGKFKIENQGYVFKSIEDKKIYEESVFKIESSPVEGKTFPLKTSQLKNIKGINATMMAFCNELITDDINILKESHAASISGLGILPSDLFRVTRGLMRIGELESEDYELSYRICRTMSVVNALEAEYEKLKLDIKNKYVALTNKGVYVIEDNAFSFNSEADKEAYLSEVDALDEMVMDAKVWTINVSELKKIKGLKPTMQAGCFELIVEDEKTK